MTAILTRLRDILGFAPTPQPVSFASQSAWHDASRERIAAMHATQAATAKERYSIARLVSDWATYGVMNRCRPTFPRVVGRAGSEIAMWLPGLNTSEIMKIAKASTTEIEAHLFTPEKIAGVRPVQPLPECPLFWPRPKLNPDGDKDGGKR